MSDTVIDIAALGKRYTLSHQHRPDSLKSWLASMVRPTSGTNANGGREDFWAIRDVSLRVGQGECLALVGKNGSG